MDEGKFFRRLVERIKRYLPPGVAELVAEWYSPYADALTPDTSRIYLPNELEIAQQIARKTETKIQVVMMNGRNVMYLDQSLGHMFVATLGAGGAIVMVRKCQIHIPEDDADWSRVRSATRLCSEFVLLPNPFRSMYTFFPRTGGWKMSTLECSEARYLVRDRIVLQEFKRESKRLPHARFCASIGLKHAGDIHDLRNECMIASEKASSGTFALYDARLRACHGRRFAHSQPQLPLMKTIFLADLLLGSEVDARRTGPNSVQLATISEGHVILYDFPSCKQTRFPVPNAFLSATSVPLFSRFACH